MKRLPHITLAILFVFFALTMSAQKKNKPIFETIYRPVYGYIMDSLANAPIRNVTVYAFDSMEDALLGKDALSKSRNPLNLRLKGDVVETGTDDTGRYMVPARNDGVLIFHLKDRKEIVVEEIAGRSEVSMGRRPVESTFEFDITELLGKDYRREPGKARRKEAEGVILDMDFKVYIPQPGEKGKESRVIVERRMVDVETGTLLSSCIPVVRDGKTFHRQRRKMISKGEMADSLFTIAENHPVLTDSTSSIRVVDKIDTEPWKDICFRLGYFVSMENAGEVEPLDTLYMMTNRINKPLKYLEYAFEPYGWEIEETTEQRRSVARRLVLQGEYDGEVPDVLKDSSYLLRELHIKAVVAPDRPYDECIILADTMVAQVMRELRTAFADKLNDQVRVTKTSQVASDTSYRNNVEYRYIFSTGRHFSRNEYLRDFRRAKDDEALEAMCRQAMQERIILEGVSWDYAANLLASVYIRQGKSDPSLLVPFIDLSFTDCDVNIENPVTFEMDVINRSEVVANQVLMLMLSERYEEASELAGILPERYAALREVALCKGGRLPSSDASVSLVRGSSPRNGVLMDMFTDKVGDMTLATLETMPQDEAMTWFLKARACCMMHDNETYRMQGEVMNDSGRSVYDHVMECLEKCFEIDPGMISVAKFDAEINEYALKEVLGVYVL